jgi:hypothetical protein
MLTFLLPPYPRSVLLAPLLWCAIGMQAAFLLDVTPDLSLLAGGTVAVALLVVAGRSRETDL